jgi:hypothetical protein
MVLSHHVYHAIHHNLTTNYQPKNVTFFKTPLKNTCKNVQNPPSTTHIFFLECKQRGLIESNSTPIEIEKPLLQFRTSRQRNSRESVRPCRRNESL